MRIGYALSYPAGLAGEAGGIRRNMRAYMESARIAGVETFEFSTWDDIQKSRCDLVHIAPADLEMVGLAAELRKRGVPFVVSPIIDKMASNAALRAVTMIDRFAGRLAHTHLGGAREICEMAAGICVRSREEQERVERGLGVRGVLHEIVFPAYSFENSTPELFLRNYDGPRDFVLFVGDLANGRKNVLRLIEACKRLELPLVLIGECGQTSYGERVRRATGEYKGARYLGRVSGQMLTSAMSACRVFALPSLMEGIGLAAIEAGMAGAPVVVTRNGGTPDYFCDLAHYVDPFSVSSIENALKNAWQSDGTRLRDHLRRSLSHEAIGPQLRDFYERAIARRTAGDPSSHKAYSATK